VLVAGNGDSIFKRLMTAIGRDDLGNDPALADNAGRVKRTAELDQAITEWTSKHDLESVLAVLEKAEVPSGRIYSIADIVADLHYQARGMVERHKLGEHDLLLPGIVPKLSQTPGGTRWIGPRLGEHTNGVLEALGYGAERIAQLRQGGAIA
jgi:formyl-CoA transferase